MLNQFSRITCGHGHRNAHKKKEMQRNGTHGIREGDDPIDILCAIVLGYCFRSKKTCIIDVDISGIYINLTLNIYCFFPYFSIIVLTFMWWPTYSVFEERLNPGNRVTKLRKSTENEIK